MTSFDPAKLTKEELRDGESDEGTYYSTQKTQVLYDGTLFYQYESEYTCNIGGARGWEHTAEFDKRDKRFLIVTPIKAGGNQSTGKTLSKGSGVKIDLGAEWKKYCEKGSVVYAG